MTRNKRVGIAGALLVAATLGLAACSEQGGIHLGSPEVHDLEGVSVVDPSKAEITTNVNSYPNITAICVHGAGFATTTRPDMGSLIRVEEWDASKGGWCAK